MFNYRNLIKNAIVFLLTFAVLIIFFHFIRFPVVDGDSMLPTYHHGDRLIVLYTDKADRGDIITIWDESLEEYLVKRVIGVSGDHVVISHGRLSVNGHYMYEPYILQHCWADLLDDVDITVEDGQYYVLGDNRNNSTDSRILGAFASEDIFGRVLK